MGELNEKCAVVGAISANPEFDVVGSVHTSLHKLQHRGQAASGIASISMDGVFDVHTGRGLAMDVFTRQRLTELAGATAIGHNRYITNGGEAHHQPTTDKPLELAMATNGNLSEVTDLRHSLHGSNIRTGNMNDSEMKASALAQCIRNGQELPDAVTEVYPLLKGAFSTVAMQGDLLVAFRDEFGLRPLSIGKISGQKGHIIASETRGLYGMAEDIAEVQPGEMLIMQGGDRERVQITEPNPKLDIFEIVYFSSDSSELYGESVGVMRRRLGKELAQQYPLDTPNSIVTGVPESARLMAEGYAHATGLEYYSLIERDRFRGGRSFQKGSQADRMDYVDVKFNYIDGPAEGRDVVVVDDSIVRLNTARKIYELMMQAGADSVTFMIGSPPIGFPDFSGIDTPDQKDLIAARLTPREIAKEIGEKCRVGYLALDRMIRATGQSPDVFNLASFNGEYPYEIGDHKNNIAKPVSIDFLTEDSLVREFE